MSHLPVGQVVGTTPSWPATKITQHVAYQTQQALFATYQATVDLTLTAGAIQTLFRTATDRGYFFPLWITCFCTEGQALGASTPSISVGWDPDATQPYINFVNQKSLQNISTGGFGRGNYVLNATTSNCIELETSFYALAAPPNKDVVLKLVARTNATIDLRTFVVAGFYTGG